jgi:CDP-diacylglycerol--glycerol-3-phosphate 3-phosphatidyltransferase
MMKAISSYLRVRASIPLKLPLFLTLGRIFVSPIFLIFYLHYKKLGVSLLFLPFLLLSLVAIAELSDFFDGFLARKIGHVTKLGKILDPMADSITHLTILLTFTQGLIQLPLLLVFIFIYRDVMVSTLRTLCAFRGYALAARASGKIKTMVQAIVIFVILFLMIPYTWGTLTLSQLQDISFLVALCAAIYTLFSGGEYLYANRSYLKQAWENRD